MRINARIAFSILSAMSPSGKNTKKRDYLIWGAGIGVSLIAAWAMFAILSPEPNVNDFAPSKHLIRSEKSAKARDPNQSKIKDTSRIKKTAGALSPSGNPSLSQSDSPSKIGILTSNDALTHNELAEKLAQIALDSNASEPERLEALEHCKNLGFSHMLPLSSDPNLPTLLADSYLNGLHQHDQRKEQVSGALGLLIHRDREIRDQAQILIGFLLGAEECVDLENELLAIDKLRAKADVFLNQPDVVDGEVSSGEEHRTSNIEVEK